MERFNKSAKPTDLLVDYNSDSDTEQEEVEQVRGRRASSTAVGSQQPSGVSEVPMSQVVPQNVVFEMDGFEEYAQTTRGFNRYLDISKDQPVQVYQFHKNVKIPVSIPKQLYGNINALGLLRFRPVQEELWNVAMSGSDAYVETESGSGKTAGYGIPIVTRSMREKAQGIHRVRSPFAVVVCPSGSLCSQVGRFLSALCHKTTVRVLMSFGGSDAKVAGAQLREECDILVATAERLWSHLERQDLFLGDLQVMVWEEADLAVQDRLFSNLWARMRQLGRLPKQIIAVTAYMPKELRYGNSELSHRMLQAVAIVHRIPVLNSRLRLNTWLPPGEGYKRIQFLKAVKECEGKIWVFASNDDECTHIAKVLSEKGIAATALRSKSATKVPTSLEERESTLQGFREGSIRILITTDAFARGLDFPDVAKVISLGLPQNRANMWQSLLVRIGRTGRTTDGHALVIANSNRYDTYDYPQIRELGLFLKHYGM